MMEYYQCSIVGYREGQPFYTPFYTYVPCDSGVSNPELLIRACSAFQA